MKIGWGENSRTTVRTFTENAVAARNRQIAIERDSQVNQSSFGRPQNVSLIKNESFSDSSESRAAAMMH